jgi:hypothetical protein
MERLNIFFPMQRTGTSASRIIKGAVLIYVGTPLWAKQEKERIMRAGFDNIRGFGAPGRHPQIKDLMIKERMDCGTSGDN